MTKSIPVNDRKAISKMFFEMAVKLEMLRLHLFYKFPEAECCEAVSSELNDLDLKLNLVCEMLDLVAASFSPIGEPPQNVQRTARERFARSNRRQSAVAQIGR